ncbi:hypothetical protein PUN28_005918 [Cardiocondyla obscurior]|uniref:Uncharacterized protein n=1 Tax=Cardiocondyla obscurior TaxID=286306 RepID=A0AAW2GB88_9HYME
MYACSKKLACAFTPVSNTIRITRRQKKKKKKKTKIKVKSIDRHVSLSFFRSTLFLLKRVILDVTSNASPSKFAESSDIGSRIRVKIRDVDPDANLTIDAKHQLTIYNYTPERLGAERKYTRRDRTTN